MATLLRRLKGLRDLTKAAEKGGQQVRHSGGGHEEFVIKPSRWVWESYKDYFHFYTMIIGGPMAAVIAYCNLIVGPATLTPIPEGYEPGVEEYYRHPISRFFAKYIKESEQQAYEKQLFYVWEYDKKRKQTMLFREVKRLMKEDGDYAAYYHSPISGRYLRAQRKIVDEIQDSRGRYPDQL